ncbi:MAG: class I SAM-dependent methyltransferase, partial [Bryobacteraceae bacterium]
MPGDNHDPKLAELTAILNEVRDRVRARHPSGQAASIPLPDLMPIVHARDEAESKVAAIGTVNPRPPGLVNSIVQGVKKTVARALDWHVREQIEFNRAAVSCVQAVLGALEDANRALAAVATEGAEMHDLRVHWEQWRRDWEQKLSANEVQFLRSVADLQVAFQHRATLMESNYRDLVRSQHESFTLALERASEDIQKRLWSDMERIRAGYEKLIHLELRVIRQRAAAQAAERAGAVSPATPLAAPAPPGVDWLRFADRFRGSEEFVREKQRSYLEKFRGAGEVLELGCGRGEFLEVLRDGGVNARGIDLSDECVALCRSKGLAVERADLFDHLRDLAPGALPGVFCAQVVEHLPPERLPEVIRLAHDKLE